VALTLVLGAARLLVVFLIFLVSVAWGGRMLGLLGLRTESHLESVLFAAGFSVASLEIVLFGLAMAGWLRFESAVALLALMALSAGRSGWRDTWITARALVEKAHSALDTWPDLALALVIAGFLSLEALLAMAPLTGSDAMHYHFTMPLLEAGHRMVAIFWLTHSFFPGQAHLLISLGLALGSDRVALGLIYLGGLLSSGALFALALRLMPLRWVLTATLTYVAAPMVFWQTSTSGSPDMWMVFFIPLAALAAARAAGDLSRTPGLPVPVPSARLSDADRWLLLAGFFAGAAAGVKYTGWIIPAALVAYILVVRRSLAVAIGAGFASLAAGIWPLLRNWLWTGDPVFPFLTPLLAPKLSNAYGLAAIKSVTSTEAFGRDLQHLLKFPFALVLHGENYGLGQYFGPLVLAFAPLLILARWRQPVARVAALFWGATSLSILFVNQMGRFLLPVYPLALALVFSGVATGAHKRWRAVTAGCAASAALFVMFSAGADALYARSFLPVVLGFETEESFLRRMAPDYAIDEFIARTLEPELQNAQGGRVMVFYRHLYYLRVPFVEGAPETSWLMNPASLRDPQTMLALLSRLDVRWIVKTEEYPENLAPVFTQMERDAQLEPIAAADIENLTGASRIYRQTENVHVVILRVNDTR
jgi:hypothetical protein